MIVLFLSSLLINDFCMILNNLFLKLLVNWNNFDNFIILCKTEAENVDDITETT